MKNTIEETVTNIMKFMSPSTDGYMRYASFVSEQWEKASSETLRYSHVREVFGDHIVVAVGYGMNATMYKIPYVVSNDEVSFDLDNQKKVELKVEWVEKSLCIKEIGENRIGGYIVLWGDETNKDLHGEWFSPETEELTKVFDAMGALPYLYHHGIDETIKTSVVAKVDVLNSDDPVGTWFEAQVLNHELYKEYIRPLIKKGILFSSSGTFPGAKRSDIKTGFIKRWPIAEVTGTVTPAEKGFLEHPVEEIKAYYRSIGIDNVEFSVETEDEVETIKTETNITDVEDTVIEVEVETVDTESMKKALDLEKLTLEILYSYS